MDWNKFKEFWNKEWISSGLIITSFVYLLCLSWGKWGDLIVDTGREMYVPEVLSNGGMLYRDVFYLYGPFSPYFHAMLFKVFGVHLNSLILSGVLTAGLAVFLVYRISRMFLNIFFSTLTSLTFLFVYAFGHYLFLANYNFIIPYSYPAIHAMVFSLAALYWFFLFIDRKCAGYIAACGVCIFLTLITRVEMGLMLAVAVAAGAVVIKCVQKSPDFRGVYFAFLFVFPFLVAGFVYSILFSAAGDIIFQSKLFAFASTNTLMDNPFTAWLSGTDESWKNFLIMAKSMFLYIVLGSWFLLGGFLLEIAGTVKDLNKQRMAWAFIGVAFLGAASLFVKFFFPFDIQYRSVPLMLVFALLTAVLRIRKSDERAEAVKMFVLALFALFVLLRIMLNVHPMHYGFSLLVPGLIMYHVVLFRIVPHYVSKKLMRLGLLVGFVCVVGILGFQHIGKSRMVYQHRVVQIGSSRGSVYVFRDEKSLGCGQLMQYLVQETRPDSSVVVLPEGLTINFLTQRRNPLYYYSYMPPDFSQKGIEEDVIQDLRRNHVDYIVLLSRSLNEYQMRVFGTDYAKKLWQYIQEFYELDQQFGPFPYTSPHFGVAVFRRKIES